MENPFIIDGYLRLEASINKVMLIDIKNLTEETEIEGKSAFDIFSTEEIIREIKKNVRSLGLDGLNIPDKELPIHLNHCLDSDNQEIKKTAIRIAEKFGERLGIILYILRRGKSTNEFERKDWNSADWEYWQKIENVVFTGGLSSCLLGEYFRKSIYKIFEKAALKPYNILLTKNSSNAGLIGVSAYINENSEANLVFDFGQSFLKRSIVFTEQNIITNLKLLEKYPSKHMEWDSDLSLTFEKECKLLDEYLQETITDSYYESEKENIVLGEEIIISMANYIVKGKILNRGGYGKLVHISDNYEEHLSCEIEKKIGKKFKIKIIHDGTAIAANFMKISNAASISLGTAFGIGFPNPKSYHKEFSDEISILK